MNALSLNIRGVGESHKVDWIRRLKQVHMIDFIGIQESRVTDYNRIDFVGCWGSPDFEFAAVNPTGRSGGLFCIWDPIIFSKINIMSSRNYLEISGHWKGVPRITTFVNVYGPQSTTDKRALWSELITLKNGLSGAWIFLGDFNAVRFEHERFNSVFCKATAIDFNRFITEADLHEFNMGGSKFTYLRDDGFKLSKIDRFLVCSNFISIQPLSSVTALARDHSDHSPLILKPSDYNFGPIPFRFFNSWLLKDDFNVMFKNT